MVFHGRRVSGSARFPTPRCFHVVSIFQRLVWWGFDRELEIAWICRCTEPAIHLWFALVGVFLDRPFFPEWPPIEMIEMIEIIEMIEMIEIILDRLGRDTLREGLRGGGQVGDILNFRGFGSGQMYGICLWFRRVWIFFQP